LDEIDFYCPVAGILRHFAQADDEAARNALYAALELNPLRDTLGKAIVELDGQQGLMRAAERVGEAMLANGYEDAPDDAWFEAKWRFGSEHAWAVVEAAAAESEAAGRYLTWLRANYSSPHGSACRFEPYTPYSEYKQGIEDYLARKSTSTRPFGFPMSARAWTRYATDDDLLQAAEDVLALPVEDTARLDFYLRPFTHRRFPLDHSRLIELVDSPNDRVVMWTLNALDDLSHPDVRALGLRLREDGGDRHRSWMGLLKRNLQEGDHELFEDSILKETNEEAMHAYGFVVRQLVEELGRHDFTDLLMLLYDRTPCGECRERFVRLLSEIGRLPRWMIEESRFDANRYLRAFIEGIAPAQEVMSSTCWQ
jgi:hypothetical protein